MKAPNNKRGQELAQLRSYANAHTLRADVRLRIWRDRPGEQLAGTMSNDAGEAIHYLDLASHYWVKRVEVDFPSPPSRYRLEYCCDPEGLYASVTDVPERAWLTIGSGASEVVKRLSGRQPAATRGVMNDDAALSASYHEHAALPMRYLRIVLLDTTMSALDAWRVWEDDYLDVTGRLEGDPNVTKQMDSERVGRGVRGSMSFTLANDDGMLDVEGSDADFYDDDGITIAHQLARVTLDDRYRGDSWEIPDGFEGSNYWPQFCAYITSRFESSSPSGGKQVEYTATCGRKGLDQDTTLPLLEQVSPDTFLHERLTMSDDETTRLCGAWAPFPPEIGTSAEEYVTSVRSFGDTWYEPILQVQGDERIHGLASDGRHLIALTFTEAYETIDGTEYNESYWSLVRFDFSGRELERRLIRYRWTKSGRPGRRRVRGTDSSYGVVEAPGGWNYSDLVVVGDKILLTESWRESVDSAREGGRDRGHASDTRKGGYPFGRGRVVWVDLMNWEPGIGGIYAELADSAGRFAAGIACLPVGSDAGGFCVAAKPVTKSNDWSLQIFDADGAYLGAVQLAERNRPEVPRILTAVTGRENSGFSEMLLVAGGGVFLSDGWITDPAQSNVQIILLRDLGEAGFTYEIGLDREILSDYAYSALVVENHSIIAAGIGPDGGREVARVADLAYQLENSSIVSVAAGDALYVNNPEFVLRIGGAVVADTDYYVDRDYGRVVLRYFPEHRGVVYADYDYRPTFSLVDIHEANRWDVINEMAEAFGYRVRIDAFDRIVLEPRLIEESVQLAGAERTWVLGSSLQSGGVDWVVAQSVAVRRADDRTLVPATEYTLSELGVSYREGGNAQRYSITAAVGTEEEGHWLIQFRVQRSVPSLDGAHLKTSGTGAASEVITRVKVSGSRRWPSIFAQHLEQRFAVAPAQARIESSFDRLVPVEVARSHNWDPTDKVYDRSDEEEVPMVHVPFNRNLLLGTSRWAVEEADPANAHYSASPGFLFTGAIRFYKVDIAMPFAHSNYHVWIYDSSHFRVATESDFDKMDETTVYGWDNVPATPDDVKTAGHYYLYMMNAGAGATFDPVIAYEKRLRYYAQDEAGLVTELASADASQRYGSAWPEKAVDIVVKPVDLDGNPLFAGLTVAMTGGTGFDEKFSDAVLKVEGLTLNADGLAVDVRTPSRRKNFLGVEVVGYPVGEAEQLLAIREDHAAIDRYGEQERSYSNRFLPNLYYAGQMGERILGRRAIEPVKRSATRPLYTMLQEGELVLIQNLGSETLREVVSLVSTYSQEASTSVITVR